MDNERAVNKILRDMKSIKLITEENGGYARVFLNALYVAGYEARAKEIGFRFQRKIELYIYDNPAGTFLGLEEAVIKSKDSGSTIKRALRYGIATKKGHIWKYIEKTE